MSQSEMWAMMVDQSERLEHTEMRMVRWVCSVLLRDRVLSAELKERMRIESVSDAMKQHQTLTHSSLSLSPTPQSNYSRCGHILFGIWNLQLLSYQNSYLCVELCMD